MGGHSVGVGSDRGRRPHDLLVEARDARGAPRLHGELDVGDAQSHVTEGRAGRMEAQPVAPRRGHRDVLVLRAVGELGSREEILDGGQPRDERLQVGHHDLHVAAHHVGLTRGQMELRLAHVDPHVFHPHHHVGVAREAETLHVEGGGGALVGHADVHVLQHHDVADVLLVPIVALHVDPPRGRVCGLS